ncbi:hypothetical protein AYI68_g1235 [Smittium mucronatum]|uniref:DUF2415 domain-containing protein n=1 Tax=Smittium mucronatum TaxID=133383 RepID=A0A1R0H621_9FUNG|nr:hypothetical protein AYI68_g1235 [Smittium mucronatum]
MSSLSRVISSWTLKSLVPTGNYSSIRPPLPTRLRVCKVPPPPLPFFPPIFSFFFLENYISACSVDGSVILSKRSEPQNYTNLYICNDVVNKIFIDTYTPNFPLLQDTPAENQKLFVCNNQNSIKIFDLPSLSSSCVLEFETPINFASISPDKSKMIAVGDSNEIYILDRRESTFIRANTITGNISLFIPSFALDIFPPFFSVSLVSTSSYFCCDWSQDSSKYAVGSQDGEVLVYDIRSTVPITIIPTVNQGYISGACRNLKFTKSDSVELLAFAEHESNFSLVDARTFNQRQVVNIDHQDGSEFYSDSISWPNLLSNSLSKICGMQFSPDSKLLYIGKAPTSFFHILSILCFPLFFSN